MLVRRTNLVPILEPSQVTGDLEIMRLRPLLAAGWWLVLTGWVAALIAPGAAAISAFTALPALGVEVPAYAAFFADDPDGAGRLAAGFVTHPIFLAADRIQLVLAGLAILVVFIGRGIPGSDGGTGRRLASGLPLFSALGCLACYLVFVAPPLAISLDDWRAAALADDAAAASTAYQIFDPLHRSAERLMTGTLASLLVLIAVCGFQSTAKSKKAPR